MTKKISRSPILNYFLTELPIYVYKNYYVPLAREKSEGVSISSHSVWSIGNRSMAREGREGGDSCMDLFAPRSLLSFIEKS